MTITDRIYQSLKVRKDERLAISLLLFHSFFIGVFLSYYLTYANGVFLKVFKPEVLPYTYVLSGIIGFIASAIFSYFQKRVPYSRVIIGTLAIIFITIILFLLGIWTIGEVPWLVFTMFMGLIPVFGLVAMQYGGMTMKLFDLLQGKRLFGVIASGEVISSIIWFFTIPIILPYLPENWYLLPIALVGLGIGIFFQWIIIARFSKELGEQPKAEKVAQPQEKQPKSKGSIGALLKNRYFSLIFFLMIFSTLGRVFVDYSFMAIARETFDNLTAFFGIFFGLLKVIELLINTFLAGRLLSKYGVRLGLMILPFLLTVFAVLSILGYWLGGVASVLVFLALAMNKLFDKTVRTSLEIPSFRNLYQPLDEETQFMVQAQTVGKASQMGVLIAGGLLILFNFILPKFGILESTYFLMGILIIWLIISRNTIKEYKKIVVEALYKLKGGLKNIDDFDIGDDILWQGLEDDEMVQKRTFQFLNQYNPSVTIEYSSSFATASEVSKSFLVELIHQAKIVHIAKNIDDAKLNTLTQEFPTLKAQEVLEYINSNNAEQQILAANALHQLRENDVAYNIEKLILTKNGNAILAAMQFLATQQQSTYYAPLFAHLDADYASRLSYYHLSKTKADITPLARQAFAQSELEHRNGKNRALKFIKILKILKENGSEAALEIIRDKITFADYEVRKFAVLSLQNVAYQANSEHRIFVKQAIVAATRHCAWLIATRLDLQKSDTYNQAILAAIDDEWESAKLEVFYLLSFIYDKDAINQIINNLNSSLNERVVLAIEMLDILLDEDIKEIVFPLVDKISETERLKQLHSLTPQLRQSFIDRLKDIINYNFSRISTWTKCVAMDTLNKRISRVSLEIIAQVYHQNLALRELAFMSIFEKNEPLYYQYIGKEKHKEQIRINRIVGLLENSARHKTSYEKVEILKSIPAFSHLSHHLLLRIAKICQAMFLAKGEALKPNRRLKNAMYIVVEGQLKVSNLYDAQHYQANELIGCFRSINLREDRFESEQDSYLLYLNIDHFFELIQVFDDIANVIYRYYIQGREIEIETSREQRLEAQVLQIDL